MSQSGSNFGRDTRLPAEIGYGRPSAGLRILVPGYAQWTWHQRERASVLLGSYLVAVGVGLFVWGTPVGWLILGFAYATHVASASDVIRQQSFPGFGRWVPMLSSSGALGLGVYGPSLVLASLLAWPVGFGATGPDRYLVNCRAYANSSPQPGDWAWFRPSISGPGRLARIIAGPGQEIEWLDEQFRVDGQPPEPSKAVRPIRLAGELVLSVPRDHVLIAPVSARSGGPPLESPLLVPRHQIAGRAWARIYPIRQRALLK